MTFKLEIEATVDIRTLFETIKDFLFVCPACGTIDIRTSKRTKLYCSNNCAARIANRVRRAKIKEGKSLKVKNMVTELLR